MTTRDTTKESQQIATTLERINQGETADELYFDPVSMTLVVRNPQTHGPQDRPATASAREGFFVA
jgi:hypothetical protein